MTANTDGPVASVRAGDGSLGSYGGTVTFYGVTGDHMKPAGIEPGDHVAISLQTTANDGDIVVAMTPKGCLTMQVEVTGGRKWLVPADPRFFTDWSWPLDQVTIVGKVVGIFHKIP
jgi:repressor LexA